MNLISIAIYLSNSTRNQTKECVRDEKAIKENLDSVTPEHELADNNTTDPTGGSNDENGGILSPRNGELAHWAFPDEEGVEGVLVISSSGPGDLPQP
jgi:hypothetical protein